MRNAPYLEMAVANKVTLMVVNRNQITFLHLIHPSYSAGKHPRMKALERLFFAALQYYTFVNHGLFDKESVNIVGIRKEQESDKEHHAGSLCPFHKLFAWFATRNHFVEQEKHVTAIERRNGKNIHKCKNNGEESCDAPKCIPVPSVGENVPDRAKATQIFCAFF